MRIIIGLKGLSLLVGLSLIIFQVCTLRIFSGYVREAEIDRQKILVGDTLRDVVVPVVQQQVPVIVTTSKTILAASNSTDYTWVGNQWIPPPGIPIYSPNDLLTYFQNRNVLFIGDSSARRAWATAYAIMNATDRSDIPVRDLEGPHVTEVHKRNSPPDRQCLLEDRLVGNDWKKTKKIKFDQYECRDLPRIEERHADTGSGVYKKTGRFDFTYFTCYSQVAWLLRPDDDDSRFIQMKQDYDLIIVALGMWETAQRGNDCEKIAKGVNHKDRLQYLLDNMKKQSSPDLQMVYRTLGFDLREGNVNGHPRGVDFNNITDHFFDNLRPGSHNLTRVDWREPVSKRSFGDDRINGDLPPHYGLQARTLFIQQLMHELMKAEAIAAAPSQ